MPLGPAHTARAGLAHPQVYYQQILIQLEDDSIGEASARSPRQKTVLVPALAPLHFQGGSYLCICLFAELFPH